MRLQYNFLIVGKAHYLTKVIYHRYNTWLLLRWKSRPRNLSLHPSLHSPFKPSQMASDSIANILLEDRVSPLIIIHLFLHSIHQLRLHRLPNYLPKNLKMSLKNLLQIGSLHSTILRHIAS